MGLFNRNTDAEKRNAFNRDIIESKAEKISYWIPSFDTPENFSVYGGDKYIRNMIVMGTISRCYGRMGVVVIHNNETLVGEIKKFRGFFPEIFNRCARNGVRVMNCNVDNTNLLYEPLYGMGIDRAVEAIYPQMPAENPSYMQQHMCAEILRKYMMILKANGKAVDLDGLLYLCNMDIQTLEKTAMQKLPQDEVRNILASFLQNNNLYLQVRADVNAFAGHLESRIWRRKKNLDEASDVSMTEAVKHRAILTVRVPSNVGVLNYLATEIRSMIDDGLEFLLALDSVMVANSTMNKEILRQYSLPISTVITCDSIAGIFDDENDMLNSLGKMENTIIMNTPNLNVAEVYSRALGQYMRQFTTTHTGSHREAFRIMGGYDTSRDMHEELFYRVTPQEFSQLGDGAVLISRGNGGKTVKTKYVNLDYLR